MGQSLGRLCGKPPSSPPASVLQLPRLPQPTQAASGGAPRAQAAESTTALFVIIDSVIEAPGTPRAVARDLQTVRLLLMAREEAAEEAAAARAAQQEAAAAVRAAQQEAAAEAAAARAAQQEAAAASARAAAAEHEVLELQMREVVAEFLKLQGALDARGVMEYFEEQMRPAQHRGKKLDRKSLWQAMCNHHPALVESILEANIQWKAEWIPDKAVQLYTQLSGLVHTGDIKASGNKVLLVEGKLSKEQVRFLECMAKAVHCPYEVRYALLPSASMQDA